MLTISERKFHIWKLELWWIAFGSEEFYPQGRTHIKGRWFWRNKETDSKLIRKIYHEIWDKWCQSSTIEFDEYLHDKLNGL